MKRYFIIPDGMPPYNHFAIEVSSERFDHLCEELYQVVGAEISTEFEQQYETLIEKWYIAYLDHGKQTLSRCFGYSKAPIGDIDWFE